MDELIKYNGEYNYYEFVWNELKFRIVGTKMGPDGNSALDCIDEFKSSDGVFSERKRRDVKLAADRGIIKPVESSRIIIKAQVKRK